MNTIRLLLADDNAVFRYFAASYLSGKAGLQVVATAGSGAEAIKRARELSPDVVLLDLDMPGMDGIQAARVITARPDAPPVIILSMHDDLEHREAARHAGAVGYVTKPNLRSELLPCILASLETAHHHSHA